MDYFHGFSNSDQALHHWHKTPFVCSVYSWLLSSMGVQGADPILVGNLYVTFDPCPQTLLIANCWLEALPIT